MQLSEHTLTSYDAQLAELSRLVLSMGAEVQALLSACQQLLLGEEVSGIEACFSRIGAMDSALEERATLVLARQSPVAIDLRFVTSVLKITSMLERAGDLAKSSAERLQKIENVKSADFSPLSEMLRLTQAMLTLALVSFSERNREQAQSVCGQDAAVDALYHDFVRMSQKRMAEQPERVVSFSHAIFIAKNIERIADYTTNLGKTVYYIASGQRLNA